MATSRLIIRKLPRGEYEIGTQTADGSIVARVSVWDGKAPERRSDEEKQDIALGQVERLVQALGEAIAQS